MFDCISSHTWVHDPLSGLDIPSILQLVFDMMILLPIPLMKDYPLIQDGLNFVL